ncbi:MAG: PIN domain-containing protein [Acidobacteria bacterium]|nr:PIN domain-containing protein [Acidobacteriota bacterium]
MAQDIIHLDTSFLIRALVSKTTQTLEVARWINSGAVLRISAVAWSEFLCGPLDSTDLSLAGMMLGEPIPFVSEDAARAAALFNWAGRRRGLLFDCMIAAVAIGGNASLATTNPCDFRRFPGLRLTS